MRRWNIGPEVQFTRNFSDAICNYAPTKLNVLPIMKLLKSPVLTLLWSVHIMHTLHLRHYLIHAVTVGTQTKSQPVEPKPGISSPGLSNADQI